MDSIDPTAFSGCTDVAIFGSSGSAFPTIGIVMAAAGIAVYTWSCRWHIVVGDNYLIAYRLFGEETVARLTDIQRMGDVGGKIQLGGNNGTIAVVYEKCGNYDRFREKLRGIKPSVQSGM